jgi:DNA-binding MarR family transcriptional regulator
MTIFVTQHIRDKAGITWGEDYVLGLIDKTAPTTASRIVDLVKKQKAMTPPTAYKYIAILTTKKLISRKDDAQDKRMFNYSLTEKGKKLMESLRNGVS